MSCIQDVDIIEGFEDLFILILVSNALYKTILTLISSPCLERRALSFIPLAFLKVAMISLNKTMFFLSYFSAPTSVLLQLLLV